MKWGYDATTTAKPPSRSPGTLKSLAIAAVVGFVMFGLVSAIFVVRKLMVPKSAEARNLVFEIATEASAAYDRRHTLCPSASQPVPAQRSFVSMTKYQSSGAEWTRDGAEAGFGCLGFHLSIPQYYQYDYQATADGFVVSAHGDLDGDGKFSTFELRGTVTDGHVVYGPPITEIDPDE